MQIAPKNREMKTSIRHIATLGAPNYAYVACRQKPGDQRGKLCLASPVMGEGKDVDGELAGRLLGQRGHGGIIKLAVGVTRKELIAVDQARQRHRFAAQSMDHMAVVHDVAAPAITVSPTALQRQQMGGPEV